MNKPITYAYIETTNYCNLKCSFCNREKSVKRLQHMSISNFKKLLEIIKIQPLKEAKLMGMGEPFLHPKFNEICSLFKETFPNTNVISSTNCQYKINNNFKESLKYIDMLYLSIDGYEESYEQNRAPAKWNTLIQFLNDLKYVEKHNCKIVINYVINSNNVYDIQKVHDKILSEYNLDEFRLNLAQNWSEDENMISDYTSEQILYLKENWKNNIKGKPIWNYSDCFWSKKGLYLTVNGDMKMCCLNTDTESFGNVFETSIEDIKSTERFQNISKGCETNKPLSHCSKCSYKELVPLLSKIFK